MQSISFDPARMISVTFRIARRQQKRFIFFQDDIEWLVGGKTWQLFIKEYPGARLNVISLTLDSGLSIPIYEDNTILADFSVLQTKITEGKYYMELVRTDLPQTLLNAWAVFSYGPTDAAQSGDIEINIDTDA